MSKQFMGIFLAVCLFSSGAYANTCVFVGGSHSWSDTSGWTGCGGVAPTANDTVLVGTGSGGSTTGTLTIDGTSGSPSLAGSLDFTSFTGTLAQGSAAQINIGGSALGSLTLVSGMTYSPNAAAVTKFVSTTTGNTIATGTKTLPGTVTFDGVGGGWTLQDAFSISNNTTTGTITLNNGALNTNGQTVTAGRFSSSNSNTRSLTLGASTFNVNGTAPQWDITAPTGMTISAASSTVTSNNTGAVTFNGGSLTYGTLNLSAVQNTALLTGANTFGTLTVTGGAAKTDILTLGANQTVSGTFTPAGTNATTNRLLINSSSTGVQRTITAATVTASNVDFVDIIGAGASGWSLSAITGLSGDCGNNSGITFTTPASQYMKTGANANWSASNWFTASGGSTSGRVPLCQDTAVFDANSFTASGKTITIDVPRIPATVWTGVTNSPTLVSTLNVAVYGNFPLDAAMTYNSNFGLTFSGRGNYTITTAGNTVSGFIILDNGSPNSYTQQDSITDGRSNAGAFQIASGTWKMNSNNITLTGPNATPTFSGGTLLLYGTFTSVAAISIAGGTVLTPGTISATQTVWTGASPSTGGSFTFGN